MVVVGAFGPGNSYAGRTVTYEAGAFTIEGLGVAELDMLRQSEAAGYFVWASAEMRAWAESLAGAASGQVIAPVAPVVHVVPVAPPVVRPPAAPPFVPATPTAPPIAASGPRFTPATIAVIVAAALVLMVSVIGIAILVARPNGTEIVRGTGGIVDPGGTANPGGGGNGSGNIDEPPIDVPAYSQYIEIRTTVNTVSSYMPGTNGTGFTMMSTNIGFQAETADGTVVGEATKAFTMGESEADSGDVRQSDDRVAAIAELISQLEADGWTQVGMGTDGWWSVQLAR